MLSRKVLNLSFISDFSTVLFMSLTPIWTGDPLSPFPAISALALIGIGSLFDSSLSSKPEITRIERSLFIRAWQCPVCRGFYYFHLIDNAGRLLFGFVCNDGFSSASFELRDSSEPIGHLRRTQNKKDKAFYITPYSFKEDCMEPGRNNLF